MLYKFDFRPYQRKFKQPLKTSHGIWEIREGIILSLTAPTGKIGWGEIAPLSWFGSETLGEALDFCRQLPPEITDEMIYSIPAELPACQFAFESAIVAMEKPILNLNSLSYSGLLPAGKTALQSWQHLWEGGYRTFKWKIGVNPIEEELELFESLVDALPKTAPKIAKMRLDANGGLSGEGANKWLEMCDNFGEIIEFVEQPLGVGEFEGMLVLSNSFSTPIALDESVASWRQMEECYRRGWRGVFVVKPSIFGRRSPLINFCKTHPVDVVFSSVFETEIGRQAALQFAAELETILPKKRALGFGVESWF